MGDCLQALGKVSKKMSERSKVRMKGIVKVRGYQKCIIVVVWLMTLYVILKHILDYRSRKARLLSWPGKGITEASVEER